MRRQAPAAGFTLIEILVVMVIFAIAAGLVTLRLLPDDSQRARREAELSALLLERAADEAERTGRALAWHPDGSAARFEAPDSEGRWEALADDPDFGSRTLQGGLQWGTLVFLLPDGNGGATVNGPARIAGTGAGVNAAAGAPGGSAAGATGMAGGPFLAPDQAGSRVVFLPGQAVPPFVIGLGTGRALVNLRGDALGHVRVEAVP